CAVWALVAVYPIVHGVFPGKPYATGKFSEEGSEITLQAPDGGKSLYINGKLRGAGDVNAAFQISGRWEGGTGKVDGTLSRSVGTVRMGRRGTARQVSEYNDQTHYLGRTHGPITLHLDQKDENIDKDMAVELRWALVPPVIVYALAILVFVVALGLDRIVDRKGRTNLGVAAAISLYFALFYGFDQVRPHAAVRPAI